MQVVEATRAGELTVEDVARASLDRIAAHNPRINAITDVRDTDSVIDEAKARDRAFRDGEPVGPLHGIVMTVKDSFDVKGLRSSYGMPQYAKHVADDDALLVRRLKNAGAMVIGKTNLPLYSIDWQSTNAWYGQSNNPYDVTRVVGGSSGGSAAAVAMGMTPLELGSDAGGSIRVPSHFCGICGMRTTEAALSNRGQFRTPGHPQGNRLLTVAGPMARSVDDLLLEMSVLWDHKELLSEIAPVDFHASSWDAKPLRLAFAKTMHDIEVDDEYAELFAAFLDRVRGAGHSLEADHPSYDEALAYDVHGRMLGFEVDSGAPTPALLTKLFMFFFMLLKYRDSAWALGVARGIGMGARAYFSALDTKERVGDTFTSFFDRYDAWLTPVASIPAFAHQRAGLPFVVNGRSVPYTRAMAGFNFTTALSGHPVVVIPIGRTRAGLPVGVQIHGKRWTDKRLLEIARHFEPLGGGFQPPPEPEAGSR